jgi:pantoate--beta-alanine ligase
MRSVQMVVELRKALAPARRRGLTIGLVPTMGALHEGHLSLIERARAECDLVVVSLFVNPAQFNERTDLERYPRTQKRDAELAADAGADVLFVPSAEEVYPPGFATAVEVLGVTDRLEGAVRGSAHFRGVSTVVTKLLCMALPDVAYFGQKDAQQVVVNRAAGSRPRGDALLRSRARVPGARRPRDARAVREPHRREPPGGRRPRR